MSLGGYLAALRALNGGRYNDQTRENGVTPFGAYGMLMENWPEWSDAAGYRGANAFDPSAQDAVAGFWATRFFSRYGSWEMVSGAWFAGQDQADMVMRKGSAVFRNKRITAFQKAVEEAQAANPNVPVPVSARRWVNESQSGRWINPIAGESEYTGGSWMPNRTTGKGSHAAIDVYATKGTPIVSPVSGTVKWVKEGGKGGYNVGILGEDGMTYYFAHMDQPSGLTMGQQIGAGNHIGFVGNTGSAAGTSPHLHFSIKEGGRAVNPKSYLDGSTNARGYFDAQNANHKMGQDNQLDGTLDSMLQRVSDGMVPEGTERKDPRLLGFREEGEGPR